MNVTTKEMETAIGRWRMGGAMEAIGISLLMGIVTIIAIVAVLRYYDVLPIEPVRDDTDPAEGGSGLAIHTDCLTGLQYLSRDGALTPRLDGQGGQVMNPEGCQ